MAPTARAAIDLSLSVFDIFGNSVAVATSAAKIVRDLCVKVDFLGRQNPHANQGIASSHEEADNVVSVRNLGASNEQEQMFDDFTEANPANLDLEFNQYDMMDVSSENLFDMAIGIDFWGDFDTLWPNTGTSSETWAFTQ